MSGNILFDLKNYRLIYEGIGAFSRPDVMKIGLKTDSQAIKLSKETLKLSSELILEFVRDIREINLRARRSGSSVEITVELPRDRFSQFHHMLQSETPLHVQVPYDEDQDANGPLPKPVNFYFRSNPEPVGEEES
ncbi:MAG: hypothetical protein AAF479_03045 [Pseudomonadota bacterium]